MKKIIENKSFKIVISVIMASIAFATLCISDVIQAYEPISWILYLMLIMLYVRGRLYDKEFFIPSIIFSALFSFFLVLGKITNYNFEDPNVNIWIELVSKFNIIYIFGLFTIIYFILINIFPKIMNFSCIQYNKKITSKKVFIISFLVIILCWIPYFLVLYPGELSPDSIKELGTIINGFQKLSNHHPLIHTITIAIPYSIGYKLFNNVNVAIAFYSITQMIIMASIFSYLIAYLHKKKINYIVLVLCLLFYALAPMHGYYSVTMWKDIIFSGLMVVLTINIINICDKNNNITFKNLIPFIITSILVILYRNNAIYMYIILAIIMIVVFRKYLKTFLLTFLIVFGCYFIINGPVFSALKVKKSASSEYIAMPLQQIARMAYKDVEFTKEEKEMLDKLMGVNNLKKYYVPQCSDGIKFNKNYKRKYFDKHKGEYLKLWMKLVLKHPDIALESYAISTLGYWYPGVNNWTVNKAVIENNYGAYRDPKAPYIIQKYVERIESRNIPIINMLWSTSLSFWILSIFAFITFKKKKKHLLAFVPVFGIWLTMMIASPVYAEFRYIYSSYTCLPLLMLIPYMKDFSNSKKYKKENNNI